METRSKKRAQSAAAASGPGEGGGQGADDDRQPKPPADLFGRNYNSSSYSTIQGLLRKLGAGYEDLLPDNQKLKGILVQLRQEDDEPVQLDALNQLCELLSISTEESLSMFPVEQLVPILVQLLNSETNSEVMLLAARALTFLADVMPSSCSSIVRHGAIGAFCARLLTIEYIDLAEQSLQALEKLSHEHPAACLRQGGLLAVLTYLDFFQTGVQRVAVATAANMCRALTTESTQAVSSAVPILTNLLQYQDAKVVENACLALTRIAEALSHSSAQLEMLCGHGVITNAIQLIAVSDSGSMTSQLSMSTYYGLIKLLATCAKGSHTVAENLLTAGVSGTLRSLLTSSTLFSSSASSASSILRSSDQLQEVIGLACQLLPPIPDAAAAILKDAEASASSAADDAVKEEHKEVCLRTRFLNDHPDVLQRFSEDLLALLLQVYGGTVLQQVRNSCLATISKIVHFSTPDILRTQLKDMAISSFIASLLAAKDAAVVAMALRLAEMLMDKLPDVFTKHFLKEGVVHAIDQLAATAPPPAPIAKPKPVKRSSSRLNKGKDKKEEKKEEPPAAAPQAAPAAPAPPPLRTAVALRAQKFKAAHFSSTSGASIQTEGTELLRAVCGHLGEAGAVKQLLDALQDKDGNSISTFEFLSSGAVAQLEAYLTGGDIKDDGSHTELLQRLRSFMDAVMAPGAGGSPALLALVRRLQGGLASVEDFSVQYSHAGASSSMRFGGGLPGGTRVGDSSSLSSGLAALTQPLKLRLCRAPQEKVLRDYSSNVVLIEPLATFNAVEDFLWPRVNRPNTAGTEAALQTAAARAVETAIQKAADAAREAGKAAAAAANADAGASTSAAATAAAGGVAGPSSAAVPAEVPASGRARRPRSDTKVQPIPEGRSTAAQRVTRAQARAAAAALEEGTVAEGVRDEGDDRHPDDVSTDEDMIMVEGGEGADEDEDMEGDEEEELPFDEDEDDEEEVQPDDDMGIGSMQVHDVHLGSDAPASLAEVSEPPSSASAPPADAAAAAPAPAARAPAAASYAQAAGPAGGAAGGAGPAGGGAAQAPQPHLRFLVNGRVMPTGTTIFQAVQQSLRNNGEEGAADGEAHRRSRRLWDDVYTVHYCRYDNEEAAVAAASAQDVARTSAATAVASGGQVGHLMASPLVDLLAPGLPAMPSATADSANILLLLKLLEGINRLGPDLATYDESQAGRVGKADALQHAPLPREEFISAKLASKLAQQLKDVLAICGAGLPDWCQQLVTHCKFLFPFPLRRRYFYCTAFGLARALQHLQQLQNAEGGSAGHADRDGRELRVSRMQRQKVRVSRKRILESAQKVMELYASHRAVLELEYFGEAGTGLGPTLEFYTLLSHELQKKGLGMWRSDDTSSAGAPATATAASKKPQERVKGEKAEPLVRVQSDLNEEGKPETYVVAPQGLFPAPLPPAESAAGSKVIERFRLLGRAMAKALQDSRMLDMPLSYVFYRAAMGKPVDLYDIRKFDAALGASLEKLYAAHKAHAAGKKGQPMLVDGIPIEDLCLTFVLPGYPGYELKPGGSEIIVDAGNVEAYIEAVVKATMVDGIQAQLAAFKEGFDEVFSFTTLECFYEDEIEAMLCGTGEAWSVEMLAETIKFDHGYTAHSTAVGYFLRVLAELDKADQRRFLRFVTGSPRLPPGGIAALHPRVTVVRKQSAAAQEASLLSSSTPPLGSSMGSLSLSHQSSTSALHDGDLPSVMTCANYIKLPPYSSLQVMRERVLYAIREGQGSFDLS
ncbi:hypothetical protein WJX72_003423 [[Myrmecia] bisecta]|uniref:HECT-type E3 ubiquitin transferase n=1 Tax=[Myrmecia] bisecta TaxID=41462 RepID=A0AAW1P129_9CHLO